MIDLIWAGLALIAVVAGGGTLAGLGRRRTAGTLRREVEANAEREGAAQARPADQDDQYPARPAVGGPLLAQPPAGPADDGGSGSTEGTLPAAAAGRLTPQAAGLGAELAAQAQGETVSEEIERLEARLTVLYAMLGDEAGKDLAASVAAADELLASGVLADAWWAHRPPAPLPELAPLPYTYNHWGVPIDMAPVLDGAGVA